MIIKRLSYVIVSIVMVLALMVSVLLSAITYVLAGVNLVGVIVDAWMEAEKRIFDSTKA